MAYDIGFKNPSTGLVNPAIEQGSTFVLDFTITDIFAPDPAVLTLSACYRKSIKSADKTEFDVTLSRTPAVPPATFGLVTCKLGITAAVTKLMAPATGVWECEIADDTGFVLKPFGCANKAKVLAEVPN